jgi:hypothetical protein
MSLREVAAQLDVSPDAIRWHLRRAGVAMRPPGRQKPTALRAPPRQWREILTDALAREEVINVRGTVNNHLRRTPTRAEITAARRAAHGIAASGQATILRVRPPGFDAGRRSAYLIFARPASTPGEPCRDRCPHSGVSQKRGRRSRRLWQVGARQPRWIWIRREAASGVGLGIRISRTPSLYAAETTSAEVPAGSRTCRTKLP